MNVQEALERVESWRNNPGIRPTPAIASEVGVTLASELIRLKNPTSKMLEAGCVEWQKWTHNDKAEDQLRVRSIRVAAVFKAMIDCDV